MATNPTPPLLPPLPRYPIADKPIDVIYSFVVDAPARFAYQGYHLVRSLMRHCVKQATDIHVQMTPGALERNGDIFSAMGCTVHKIEPFGDGQFCNKLAQLDNLLECDCQRIVLLDADMIAVADVRPYLGPEALLAKAVDLAYPPIEVMRTIAAVAGMKQLPAVVSTDGDGAATYQGNCNGGFYSIPRELAPVVQTQWRKWAQWLLQNIEPLRQVGRENNVDQVAMWLAIQMEQIPFLPCSSNLNYFVHSSNDHYYYDPQLPIVMLHYHHCLNVVGLIEPEAKMEGAQGEAIRLANAQIGEHFNNRLFWDLRYENYPERGSGFGSLGENLLLKRQLLAAEGIENAASMLDVGCGNLEVIKVFNLRGYLGLDASDRAVATARAARPDWSFAVFDLARDGGSIPSAEVVICLEVLIHQETAEAYHRLIDFLARKTGKKLIVSGYEADDPARKGNQMLFFHEPLRQSLERTGRFGKIEVIGRHTDVVVMRCEV